MQKSCAAIAAVLLAAFSYTQLAAQSAAQPSDRQSFASATTAILVDVVVRDRKGQLVTDLSANDFDVAEDGVAQKVDTFTRVSHGGGIGLGVAWKSAGKTVSVGPSATPAAARDALADDATTALVFDHLSTESL